MQGTSTRPAALHALGPRALRARPRKSPPPTRGGDGRGGSAGTVRLGRQEENQRRASGFLRHRDRPVGGLLRGRNGSIARTSCTSASNSPWEGEGRGGARVGDAGGRGRGGASRGGSEQAAAGLSPRDALSPGLAATCPRRPGACPPLSGRPGTASGPPGCS